MAYKIEQDMENCIGCGACVSICPENWEMNKDGKAKPKKIKISDKEFDKNKQAEEICTVNVIKIKKA